MNQLGSNVIIDVNRQWDYYTKYIKALLIEDKKSW